MRVPGKTSRQATAGKTPHAARHRTCGPPSGNLRLPKVGDSVPQSKKGLAIFHKTVCQDLAASNGHKQRQSQGSQQPSVGGHRGVWVVCVVKKNKNSVGEGCKRVAVGRSRLKARVMLELRLWEHLRRASSRRPPGAGAVADVVPACGSAPETVHGDAFEGPPVRTASAEKCCCGAVLRASTLTHNPCDGGTGAGKGARSTTSGVLHATHGCPPLSADVSVVHRATRAAATIHLRDSADACS